MSLRIPILTATLVAALAISPLARAADPPISLNDAYAQIKDAERSIPIPTPEATVQVGSFDATSGAYDGLAVETEIINHKPVRIVPNVFVNAANTRLSFSLQHVTGLVRLTAAGATAIVNKGATSISIDVGKEDDVRWRITAGTKSHSDELTISRPRIIGAGAFTIPALPVGVVYDSPQDPGGTNNVVYTRSTSVGTSVGLTVRDASSSSASAVNPDFPTISMFHSQLQATAGFASATGNSAAATALTKIDSLLGKATRNVNTSEDSTSTSRRTYTFTESHTCAPDPLATHGPGHGDRIAYLRNARLVWLNNGSQTYAQLLGYGSYECPTIDQLSSGVAGLSAAAAAPLIALDPFTGPLGAKTPLAGDRFVALPGIGLLPGLIQIATYQQQLLLDHSATETSTRVVTDDLGAGLLSLVGLAPSQSGTFSSTLAVSSTATTSESTTVTTTLTARTLTAGVRTELAVFYDRLFGNVAFQDPRP
jgi:hypothetical protein